MADTLPSAVFYSDSSSAPVPLPYGIAQCASLPNCRIEAEAIGHPGISCLLDYILLLWRSAFRLLYGRVVGIFGRRLSVLRCPLTQQMFVKMHLAGFTYLRRSSHACLLANGGELAAGWELDKTKCGRKQGKKKSSIVNKGFFGLVVWESIM